MTEILVSPMSLVGMTIYHTKNLPHNIGASYGLLYAVQEELSYKISMTSPLGTHSNSTNQIVSRMVEYQILRLRKGKNNLNFYEEFIMIGWYVMASEKYINDKVNNELNAAFLERGAPYSLIYMVNSETNADPLIFKGGKPIKYKLQIDPRERYCADALKMQSSKKESVYATTLKKEKNLIDTYNKKLQKLTTLFTQTKDEEKKRQILQIMELYDRMEGLSTSQKVKTIEAINYSVLTGLILTHQNDFK